MLEKDNEAEDEKAGGLQWCTQTWGSLAGHVVPGPMVMRKWGALGDDMGKRYPRGHPWKTTNEPLTQSIKFSIIHTWLPSRQGSRQTSQENCHIFPTLWMFPCANLPNYLLGISLECGDNFLRQSGKSPMRTFLRPVSSSLLFFNDSWAPLATEWLPVQVILSG